MNIGGINSFAGHHDITDEKYLTVIDISPYKKGILDPKEFLRITEYIRDLTPRYLGFHRFDQSFIHKIYHNELEGITFEGIVGKRQDRKRLIMTKAKTKQWLDKVMIKFGDAAYIIIES